mmetsp:Transcript_39216/g.82131  ORF Transcript_39216/g.82131 Transcript_39216/m.82131 type:complete len:218 (+) Transcript_39216:679-1332(+)
MPGAPPISLPTGERSAGIRREYLQQSRAAVHNLRRAPFRARDTSSRATALAGNIPFELRLHPPFWTPYCRMTIHIQAPGRSVVLSLRACPVGKADRCGSGVLVDRCGSGLAPAPASRRGYVGRHTRSFHARTRSLGPVAGPISAPTCRAEGGGGSRPRRASSSAPARCSPIIMASHGRPGRPGPSPPPRSLAWPATGLSRQAGAPGTPNGWQPAPSP